MAYFQGTEAMYNTNSSSLFNVWGKKKKSHDTTFFYTLMQAEKAPKMLLTSVVKGHLASCKWLWDAGTQFPFFLSKSSSFSAASPCKLLCKVRGKQKAVENRDWSSSSFRRAAALASIRKPKFFITCRTKYGNGSRIQNGRPTLFLLKTKHLTYLGR